jgi:hypothetical protein
VCVVSADAGAMIAASGALERDHRDGGLWKRTSGPKMMRGIAVPPLYFRICLMAGRAAPLNSKGLPCQRARRHLNFRRCTKAGSVHTRLARGLLLVGR